MQNDDASHGTHIDHDGSMTHGTRMDTSDVELNGKGLNVEMVEVEQEPPQGQGGDLLGDTGTQTGPGHGKKTLQMARCILKLSKETFDTLAVKSGLAPAIPCR